MVITVVVRSIREAVVITIVVILIRVVTIITVDVVAVSMVMVEWGPKGDATSLTRVRPVKDYGDITALRKVVKMSMNCKKLLLSCRIAFAFPGHEWEKCIVKFVQIVWYVPHSQ